MSVRKREWITRKGEHKSAYIVDYFDGEGKRHIETFARVKDAKARHASVHVDLRKGTHTPVSQSPTVAEAAQAWVEQGELDQLERSTIEQYRQHAKHHIVPKLGRERVAKLTIGRVEGFRNDLLRELSRATARKVFVSFKSILRHAKCANAAVLAVSIKRSTRGDGNGGSKLEVGRDIPTVEEAAAIINHAGRSWRPLLLTAASTGLRSSELRGLRWCDVDLKHAELHVRQRADRWGVIDVPKSRAGTRSIPLRPDVVRTLKEWQLGYPRPLTGEVAEGNRLREPPKPQHLVFPNGAGKGEHHSNILQRGLQPAQIAAGITVDGKAKYTGLHALRHFFASWCINPKDRGGRGLQPKEVQTLLGHATIAMTMDTYGHLFPKSKDDSEPTAFERALDL